MFSPEVIDAARQTVNRWKNHQACRVGGPAEKTSPWALAAEAVLAEANRQAERDEPPDVDWLVKNEFGWNDETAMRRVVTGLKIIVGMSRDNEATSLSLGWDYAGPSGSITPRWCLRDNPSRGDILDLVKALSGE